MRISLFFLFVLFSCNPNEEKVVRTFYENGKVKEIIEVSKDSIRNGEYKGYFENGSIEEISNYVEGKLHGVREIFYPNGKIRGMENYVSGKMNGEFRYFFDNGYIETLGNAKDGEVYGKALNFFQQDSGKINVEANFLIVKGESVRTNYVQYSPRGDTIKVSPFVSIEMMDSIPLNSNVVARIKLLNPKQKYTHFIIKDFDESIEGLRIDLRSQHDATTHQMMYKIDTSKKGIHYFRGIAIHHSITKIEKELIISEGEFNIYFEKKYCVF